MNRNLKRGIGIWGFEECGFISGINEGIGEVFFFIKGFSRLKYVLKSSITAAPYIAIRLLGQSRVIIL